MYYEFILYAWVVDSDPTAAKENCGRSVSEKIVAENVKDAIAAMIKKYPTVYQKGMRVTCNPLELDFRYDPETTQKST